EARILTDSRQAAGTLRAAAHELVAGLQARGLDVSLLDVRCGAEGDRRPGETGQGGGRGRRQGSSEGDAPTGGLVAVSIVSDEPATSSLLLPDGTLVDVLA
ncbi:MAG TPA: hypothetical protein VHB30_06825, partial [Solirubrobacteraceae bacterium]|nr:hypothetical protein [Solirubrobacteraceae bacterium]